MNEFLADLPRWAILLVPIVVLQIGLQIAALIDLSRQPAEALRGPKWAWAVAIVLLELFGPVVYFFFGKKNE